MTRKSGKGASQPSPRESQSPAAETAAAPDAARQTELFEQAVLFFGRGDYAGAWPLFEQAAKGPLAHVAAAARSRARICEWKCSEKPADPQTAEDHYHFGLAFLNQRRHLEAEQHFQRALEMAPESDHVWYVLALSQGWRGDIESSAASLRRAVELNPGNRIQARKDPDYQDLLRYPAIAEILYPERGRKV